MWVQLEDPSPEKRRAILKEITERARFLVDESLGEAVNRVLKDRGWNTVFGPDVGLQGRGDEEVFAFAWREKRVILTHDRDFLDNRRFPFHRNPGVIVLPGGDGKGSGLVRALLKVTSLVGHYRRLFENAKIEVSEDGQWSVYEFIRESGRHFHRRFRFSKHEVWEWEE